MKKYLLILCIVCFKQLSVNAQGAGYLGKHFILRTDIQTNFTATIPAFWDEGKYFKTRLSFGLDYLINNRMSLGLSYTKFSSRFDFKEQFTYHTYAKAVYMGNWEYGSYNFSSDAKGDINARVLSLNMKYYTIQHITLVGPYLKFELSYVPYTVNYNHVEVLTLRKGSYEFQKLPDEWENVRYSDVFIGLGIGKQRVFFERLVLNLAINSQLSLRGIDYFVKSYIELDNLTSDNYIKNVTSKSLFNHSFLCIEAGLGFLIF